jgi:D-alanyl-D-alanine carboxypeptidase
LGRKEHQQHWIGCKTGVTDSAGPCFSGFYENNDTGDKYCVVVLGCKSMESRWVEVPRMVKWAIETKQALKNSVISTTANQNKQPEQKVEIES